MKDGKQTEQKLVDDEGQDENKQAEHVTSSGGPPIEDSSDRMISAPSGVAAMTMT